jgi:hypothetical protein
MATKELFVIAFDLGGVIFARHNDNRFFKKNYLETELSFGIYTLITDLSKDPTIKLIIISKAFPKNAKRSKEILDLYKLTEHFNSIIFCEDNASKYPIAKAMKVDLMIDDKPEVLEPFHVSIPTFLYNSESSSRLRGVISMLRAPVGL